VVREVVVMGAALLTIAASPAAALGATCPDRTSADQLSSQARIRALNEQQWKLGPRPTGTRAHARFIDLLEREMRAIDGVRTSSVRYRIRRWDSRSTTMRLDGADLPVAGPVPYAKATGAGGVTAPLAAVPPDQAITTDNAAGRIVVRDATPTSVPLSVFFPGILGRSVFDPGATLDRDAPYQRDFLSYDARVQDLEDAARAGAAGVLFLLDRPREQVAGHYAPYEGVHWGVPAAFLGADESQRVREALAGGAPSATLAVDATTTPATTRMLLARLPGASRERLVVESHTDGVNAVWDNGPVAMIAMARYLARLPRACRPRTIQFAFTTGHLYQRLRGTAVRDGSAELLAHQLDRDYDKGTVAGVVAVEHLGARQYEPVARSEGAPGRVLRRTGRSELTLVGVTDSSRLVRAVETVVLRRDLRRTAVLAGADIADAGRVPPHCSMGGEGTSYNKHLLPTVGLIAAPATLYDPPFGLEGIDFAEMRAQTLAITDLLLALGPMSRSAIAGKVIDYRRQRRNGTPGCPTSL
jgi:hypothetical protein